MISLAEVSKDFDENEPDDANMAAIEELSGQIETAKKSLATLKRAEATLAMTSRSVEDGAEGGNEGNENKDESERRATIRLSSVRLRLRVRPTASAPSRSPRRSFSLRTTCSVR